MFRIKLCAAVLSAISFTSSAVETLDVLVVFDQNTISSYSKLDTFKEQQNYANELISNMNTTFINSGLGNKVQFTLDGHVLSRFSAYNSGSRETLTQISNRYLQYFATNASDKTKSVGTLYGLQKQYKADVVIGVLKGTQENNSESITCGKALLVPNKGMIASGSTSSLMEVGPLGLFFIQAHDLCYENETIAAHEFGHTVGLYHGPATDTLSTYNSYKDNMVLRGAAGYYRSDLDFQTIMSYRNTATVDILNQFSDKDSYSCDSSLGITYLCGNSNFDAIETLQYFRSNYNKRGNWYQ